MDNVVRLREQQLWPYPDPLQFALAAVHAGVDGVLLSLHVSHVAVSDRNWQVLGELQEANLCLAAPPRTEVLQTVAESNASRCVLVPGSRHEHSSGGALAVAAIRDRLTAICRLLEGTDIELSARIDPELTAVSQCAEAGLQAIELNTSAFALAGRDDVRVRRLDELTDAINAGLKAGLRVSIRGGLDYENVGDLCRLSGLAEMRVGQALISQALFDGIGASIARMRDRLGG